MRAFESNRKKKGEKGREREGERANCRKGRARIKAVDA